MKRHNCWIQTGCICILMLLLLPVIAGAEGSAIADSVTLETTGVDAWSSTYVKWETTGASEAVYKGNSAGGNHSILLSSHNSSSGIVTAVSAGRAVRVSVSWSNETYNGRALNVYGKNTAYSEVTDLYGSDAGTLLGRITYGTDSELSIDGDYAFIGLRAKSGDVYLNQIDILWEADGSTEPTIPPTHTPAPTTTPTPDDSFTVSFESGIGSGTMESQTDIADAIVMPDCLFTAPEGQYRFAGWKIKNGNGTVYQAGETVPITKDTTFVAVWRAYAFWDMTEKTVLSDGDRVVICHRDSKAVLSADGRISVTENGVFQYRVDGYQTETAENCLVVPDDAALLIVETEDEAVAFHTEDGQYLLLNDAGVRFAKRTTENKANTLFWIEQAEGGFYLRNGLKNGGASKYLRYDQDFSGGDFWIGSPECYTMCFYAEDEALVKPQFYGQSLELSGKIGIRFYMNLDALSEKEKHSSGMSFSVSGSGSVTPWAEFDGENRIEPEGLYYFTCYLNSIQMADTVTATYRYVQNGRERSIKRIYSVKHYVEEFNARVQEDPDWVDDTTKRLVNAVADYGHYAQISLSAQNGWQIGSDYAEMDLFFTEEYPIAQIKSEIRDYAFSCEPGGANISKIIFATVFDSETTIRVYFTPTQGYSGTFAAVVDGKAYSMTASGGRYLLEIANIPSDKLSEAHTIALETEDGTATVRISALSYAESVFRSSNDTAALNAMAAFYRYAMAAEAFMAAHTN